MAVTLTQIKRKGTVFAYIVGVWAAIAFIISIFTFLQWGWELPQKGWPAFFLFELICIAPWPFFTPAIVWLYHRFNFKKPKRFKSILVHAGTGLVFFSIHCSVQSLAVFSFFNMAFNIQYFLVDFIGFLNWRLIFYAGVILTVKVLEFYKKNQEISLKEPKLRAKLNRIKFQGLKNQVQPGFLLQTLDVVSENIEKRPDVAEEIVADLSDLLRAMLDLSNPEEVEIIDDIRHLRLYLKVLNKKADVRIELETEIDAECYDACIPTVVYLIPFFEALQRHHLRDTGTPQKIIYNAHKRFNRLHHRIIFDGVAITSERLHNIQSKVNFHRIVDYLKHHYSKSGQLNCVVRKRALEIIFDLPFKRKGAAKKSTHVMENV